MFPHNGEYLLTLIQAKAVLSFVEAISEKTLRNTVALTAARGRGLILSSSPLCVACSDLHVFSRLLRFRVCVCVCVLVYVNK